MTPRAWILMAGMGLSAALLPSCTWSLTRESPPPAVVTASRTDPADQAKPASPYALVPTDPALQDAGPGHVTPVGYPEEKLELEKPPPSPVDPLTKLPPAPAVEAQPAQPEPATLLALRHLLANRPDQALAALKKYDPATQELLLNLMPLVAQLSEESIKTCSPQSVAHMVEQLGCLEMCLRPKLPLHIGKMCFCRHEPRVFGKYEPLPGDYEFRAGANGEPGELVHVYLELPNLMTRQQGEFYETCLASKVEICDMHGHRVCLLRDEPIKRDRSRSLCRDFFIYCRFEIPAKIPPGAYTLWIEVKDLLSQPNRSTRQPLDFHISAQGTPQAARNDADH